MVSRWYVLRRLFKYTSLPITFFEKSAIKRHNKVKSPFPTIYIIGPPRSGSTLYYQLITNYFDVLYIDNFADLARDNLFFGISISQKKYGAIPHNCFTSKHGRTSKLEPHAPNEGQFWYNYFPKDRHHVEINEYSENRIEWIKKYHNAIKNKFKKPLVIKNLSFSLRLELIKKIEPDALIIHITRDPADIIYSIFKARIHLNWPENKLWSIKPKNYEDLEKLPVLEQITLQIMLISKEIEKNKLLFQGQYMKFDYQDICNKPLEILKDFQNKVGMVNVKNSFFPDFSVSSRIPADLSQKIQELVNKYEG